MVRCNSLILLFIFRTPHFPFSTLYLLISSSPYLPISLSPYPFPIPLPAGPGPDRVGLHFVLNSDILNSEK